MKKLLFAVLVLLVCAMSCRKNEDDTTIQPIGAIPEIMVESSLIGIVQNADNLPIIDAQVTINGQQFTTNNKGLFFIKNKLLNQNGTLVTVQKFGYFTASRFAFPSLGATSKMVITMTSKSSSASFSSGTGGNFETNGVSINIPSNAVVKLDGTIYSGTVNAYLTFLDPTLPTTNEIMPGDFRGITANQEASFLKSYGMFGVELESPNGQKLNLGNGQKATFTMTVPTSLQSSAPATIPLWHFDENSGYWMEEGNATLSNNQYSGTVAHFSFWNCDIPTEYALITGKLVLPSGQAVPNYRIEISSTFFGTRNGYSNSNGTFGGLMPKNEVLTMKVIDACGNLALEKNIGPFTADTDLGNIEVADVEVVKVTGRLLDCNGNPMSEGLANVQSIFVFTDMAGNFEATVLKCQIGQFLTVQGFSTVDVFESAKLDFGYNGSLMQNVGDITVCTSLDEYVNLTINGTNIIYNTYVNWSNDTSIIGDVFASKPSPSGLDSVTINFSLKNYQTGTPSLRYLGGQYIESPLNTLISFGCEYCTGCDCAPADVTNISLTSIPTTAGTYAMGSITGKVRLSSTQNLVPFSLSFRAKKDY